VNPPPPRAEKKIGAKCTWKVVSAPQAEQESNFVSKFCWSVEIGRVQVVNLAILAVLACVLRGDD